MYEFRELDLSKRGIQQITDLLNLVFLNKSFGYINWEYNQNPVGEAVGYNAFNGKELVAHYVTLPIESIINGERVNGLLSLNTATHPNHRGKRLFTTLADKTYENGKKRGYKYVIGVANQNSSHGFLKYLGFKLVTPLLVKIGLQNVIFEEADIKNYQYMRHWSQEALEWGIKNPMRPYNIREIGGNYCIYAPSGKYGINAIMGYFIENQYELVKSTNYREYNPLKIWMGINNKINLSKFIEFPSILKPSPLNLIFKDMSGLNFSFDKNHVKFQAIDFDPY